MYRLTEVATVAHVGVGGAVPRHVVVAQVKLENET
jgi:hypothetical protein